MNQKANPPDPSLPVSQLIEVDKVCRKFEAEWKAGRQPKVTDYLGTTPEPQRSELKRELDAIEAEFRSKSKPQFSVDEFVQRITSSGLMTIEEVSTFVSTLPADKKPKTAEELARRMYRQGRLTKFQAQASTWARPADWSSAITSCSTSLGREAWGRSTRPGIGRWSGSWP